MTIRQLADILDARTDLKVIICRDTDERTQERTGHIFEDLMTFNNMMDLFLQSVEMQHMEEINKMEIQWVDVRTDKIVIKVYR